MMPLTAAGAEAGSEHPVAVALVGAARGRALEVGQADEFRSLTGCEAEVLPFCLDGRRFAADYRSRANDADEVKTYEVNPLGLVVRGNLLYLVCTLWDYQDIRQLALHRVLTANPTDKPVTRPGGFNLDAYIQSGEFQYPCVASATSGQKASVKMRDFELLRAGRRWSEVYEQRRTPTVHGGTEVRDFAGG